VFVANGDSDPMILPRYSYLLAGLLPDARLTIYPDSAHGFLFQHHPPVRSRRARLPRGARLMPMIDVYAAAGTFPDPHRLAQNLAAAVMRWEQVPERCIERDVPLIAKSTHRERIAENAEIFDFALSSEDMAELDALDRTGRTERALERKWL
jgi:hypothetical protein